MASETAPETASDLTQLFSDGSYSNVFEKIPVEAWQPMEPDEISFVSSSATVGDGMRNIYRCALYETDCVRFSKCKGLHFRYWSEFKDHTLTHVRQYFCDNCGKQFSRKDGRQNHQQNNCEGNTITGGRSTSEAQAMIARLCDFMGVKRPFGEVITILKEFPKELFYSIRQRKYKGPKLKTKRLQRGGSVSLPIALKSHHSTEEIIEDPSRVTSPPVASVVETVGNDEFFMDLIDLYSPSQGSEDFVAESNSSSSLAECFAAIDSAFEDIALIDAAFMYPDGSDFEPGQSPQTQIDYTSELANNDENFSFLESP